MIVCLLSSLVFQIPTALLHLTAVKYLYGISQIINLLKGKEASRSECVCCK